MYAQSNDNYYPGFDATGAIVDATVEYRYQVLLDGNFFMGEYMISPAETKTEWTTGTVTSANYSFAMLDIDASGGRAEEWSQTDNTLAPVMSDRNTGTDAHANVDSIHGDVSPGDWRGRVAWNDNHVSFDITHELETQYGSSGTLNKLDNLFEAAGTDDAMMIHSGN